MARSDRGATIPPELIAQAPGSMMIVEQNGATLLNTPVMYGAKTIHSSSIRLMKRSGKGEVMLGIQAPNILGTGVRVEVSLVITPKK